MNYHSGLLLNWAFTTYTFDGKDRLTLDVTSVTDAHTYTYTYDSRDNMLTATESGAARDHELRCGFSVND